jgi:CRP/FNR family transcriptional regulator
VCPVFSCNRACNTCFDCKIIKSENAYQADFLAALRTHSEILSSTSCFLARVRQIEGSLSEAALADGGGNICGGGAQVKNGPITLNEASRTSLSLPPARKLPCDSCPGRSLGICSPLDDQGLGQLLALGGRRHWSKREFIYRADEPVQMFYKITRGIVVESRMLDDGRRQIVGIRATGDLCGFPENGGRQLFSGQALTEVEACAFEKRKFHAFIGHRVDLARALADETSRKLKRATENLMVMGQLKSTERVAHFVAEISELHASKRLDTPLVKLHLTRQEVGDYLGLTLETVSRSFTKLRQLRVLALVGSDGVAILDRKRLYALAQMSPSDEPL